MGRRTESRSREVPAGVKRSRWSGSSSPTTPRPAPPLLPPQHSPTTAHHRESPSTTLSTWRPPPRSPGRIPGHPRGDPSRKEATVEHRLTAAPAEAWALCQVGREPTRAARSPAGTPGHPLFSLGLSFSVCTVKAEAQTRCPGPSWGLEAGVLGGWRIRGVFPTGDCSACRWGTGLAAPSLGSPPPTAAPCPLPEPAWGWGKVVPLSR